MSVTLHTNLKSKSGVIPLAPLALPFETWRPILQDVYATQNSISHPPSDFEFSPLHSRLNVYRNLALVSKSWRANARDVFFEELQAHTADSLRGIIQTFQKERSLALAVSRISFSFWDFRCSASQPRKPRPLRPDTESNVGSQVRAPNWKTIHRRDARKYQPSTTTQGSHWTRWQADTAQVLTMCSSLSEVVIVFTSSIPSHRLPVSARVNYRAFFAPPDLTNEKILTGLLYSPNLRNLHLTNPTPLKQYGPTFASWTRLKSLSINLTQGFKDLTDTAFIPPKSLTSFRFHDCSSMKHPWPLASDLARCNNLQVLDLGVTKLTNEQTFRAIQFLCVAYQHSLQELILEIFDQHAAAGQFDFQNIFVDSSPPLCFPRLERLRLLGANYDTSIFSSFKAVALTYVEVRWLNLEPSTGTLEDRWSKALRYSSISKLKQLVINLEDPDHLRKEALHAVCGRLGIQVETGRAPRETLTSEGMSEES